MNYVECLKYLEEIQNLGIKFGLDNVRAILASMNNPHRRYPSILVAGTNGKGSVCAILTRILTLHGFRVGLFTSPHLVRVEERIRIGAELISVRTFCRLLTQLKAKIEQLISSGTLLSPPTYFELLTCLALTFFEERRVDITVLEVGMGGRFDATNVVKPLVTVITTISWEHQKFLGNSLEEIASEKAGIIRENIPVVCGVEAKEAFQTIKRRARELRAPFFGVFENTSSFLARKKRNGYVFEYISEKEKYRYSPRLAGHHQGKNAALAIVTAERLSEHWMKLEKRKIVQGIETAEWPGRLEIISSRPLVVLDGAHNEQGAEVLRDYIHDFDLSPVILVYAAMRDKKVENIASLLFPLSKKVILTRFPFYKGASPKEIRDRVLGFEDRLVLEPDPRKAFLLALQDSSAQDCILVTGSLYLVGEIKKFFPHGVDPFRKSEKISPKRTGI
ncbi:MAG: bifunctional folylpolyglutamate synthase/dihydrofolate synthase [Candidatus Aminicenantales bacterium]